MKTIDVTYPACDHVRHLELPDGWDHSDAGVHAAVALIDEANRIGCGICKPTAPNAGPDLLSRQRAIELAQEPRRWLHVRIKATGKKAYAVPSSTPNKYWLCNQLACNCPDYERRGLPCKHIYAVRAHCTATRQVANRANQQENAILKTIRAEDRY